MNQNNSAKKTENKFMFKLTCFHNLTVTPSLPNSLPPSQKILLPKASSQFRILSREEKNAYDGYLHLKTRAGWPVCVYIRYPWLLKWINISWFEQRSAVISVLSNTQSMEAIIELWNNTEVTWHMIIQAAETLQWVSLAAPYSLSIWNKYVLHSQNPHGFSSLAFPLSPQAAPPLEVLFPA